jgi:hypothetical protein
MTIQLICTLLYSSQKFLECCFLISLFITGFIKKWLRTLKIIKYTTNDVVSKELTQCYHSRIETVP